MQCTYLHDQMINTWKHYLCHSAKSEAVPAVAQALMICGAGNCGRCYCIILISQNVLSYSFFFLFEEISICIQQHERSSPPWRIHGAPVHVHRYANYEICVECIGRRAGLEPTAQILKRMNSESCYWTNDLCGAVDK